jgi:hypothetical protein
MVSMASDVMNALRRAHAEQDGDVHLGHFLARYPDLSDDELADLIELDARERLRAGRRVELPRYLESIHELPRRRVALDAAIEFALRSLSGSRHTKIEAVEALCRSYPDLVPAISAAWFLNDALGSTANATALVQPQPELRVPMGIGPQLPSGVHRYELRERLGKGSHGSVYLGVDHALSEADRAAWVAIKVTMVLPGQHPLAHRVREEATKARRVTHPNIARVLDRGVIDDGREFIVYEHVDAGDLQDAYDRGRVSRDHRRLAVLVAKVCRAVQAAHSAGLIHSDLKPSNVLLTSTGEPKVADFGLAVRRFDLDETSAGVQLGTLGFIAPERYRAEPGSEGVASDVYSLGGILYFLLTGRAPNGSTPDEVAERLGVEPEHAAFGPPLGVPADADLEAICRRALAPRPSDRYASADALANDLETWAAHRPLAWRASSPLRTARLFVRRNPAVFAAAIVLALGAVGATAAITRERHRTEENRLRVELQKAEDVAEVQSEAITNARRMAGSMISVIMAKRGDMGGEWVSFLTIAEAVAGPVLFDASRNERFDQLWAARVDLARDRVERARTEGRFDDSDTLLWRVGLGFWLLKKNEFAEAASVLDDAARAWAKLGGPNDTWAIYARALAAAARVREATSHAGPLDEPARERLAALAAEIESCLPIYAGPRAHTNVHRESLEALALAYSEGALNQPDNHQRAAKQLEEFKK